MPHDPRPVRRRAPPTRRRRNLGQPPHTQMNTSDTASNFACICALLALLTLAIWTLYKFRRPKRLP